MGRPSDRAAPGVAPRPASHGSASLLVAGAAPASRLVARLRAALGSDASVIGDAAWPEAPRRWRALLDGTDLDWRGAARPAPHGRGRTADDPIMLDLHGGTAPPPGRRVWRVTDAAGTAALAPFFALDRCCRTPGSVALFLIETRDGGRSWFRLGEAHPGAWRPYRALLVAIGIACAALVASALRGTGGAEAAPWLPEATGGRRQAPRPGRAAFLRCRASYAGRRLRDKLTAEHWAIGVLEARHEDLLAGGPVSPSSWINVPAHQGFLADPFPWPGRPGLLLCERFDHRTGLGRLQALSLAATRADELPLDFRGHLSYPFPWEQDGRVFCLPEMAEGRRQLLYELRPGEAPRAVATVAEGVAMADATLFRHGGSFWIAYTDVDIGPHDNLCLLRSDSLFGPWTPHRGNPVKVDVRSSRCAGALIPTAGGLIRPAQDCADGYGTAIVLNRVLACTPEVYREEPVARLSADREGPYPDGLHTLSLAEGAVFIDGKRAAVDPRVVLHRARRAALRLVRRAAARAAPDPAAPG